MTLFVFDLDDTLLDRQKNVGDKTASVLERRLEMGDHLALVTSRPSRSVRKFVDPSLLERAHLISLNGAVMKPCGGSPVVINRLGIGLHPVVESLVERKSIHFSLELSGESFATNSTYSEAELDQYHNATPEMVIPIADIDKSDVCKLAIDGLGANIMALGHWINSHGLNAIPALQGCFLNVVDRSIDKAQTLARLTAQLGIEARDLVVFGDDHPDQVMMEFAGVSVAMGNATESVKSIADHVIGDCDDDAIGEFINGHF